MTRDLSESVRAVFAPDGPLQARPGYEVRPQQAAMAAAVARALGEAGHLIMEAPTGVGKTLAYLVPALIFAERGGGKAIISTHTKNLQEQLVHKDFPMARALTGAGGAVAILKGRRNYLCTTRLGHAGANAPSLFDAEGRDQLALIRDWSQKTREGDAEELPFAPRPDVWDAVCSEHGVCSTALCGTHCFFQRARLRARDAAVVVLNHALFFALLPQGGAGEDFLFPGDFVVIDEAHTLETVAGAGIGLRISHRQTILAIRKLHHPGTKKGLFSRRGKKYASLCAGAEAAADEFFTAAGQAARMIAPEGEREAPPRHDIRIRHPHFTADTLGDHLAALETAARACEEGCADMFRSQELALARAAIGAIRTGVNAFLEQIEPDMTYWVELSSAGSASVTLAAAPSDIGQVLGPRLFREGKTVIMTSATLSVNGSLSYFRNRVGAPECTELILDSPFDHARQMRLCVAREIPEPDSDGYMEELPAWILRSIERTHGRALVLFTSMATMRAVAGAISGEISRRGLRLMVQGIDGQRHRLLEEFKRDIGSVLFGLDSFWMGIDVPGEALEHVVITRLPFAMPSHPLIEARLEKIAARGGNAFLEYTLPEAILKFKQGAGRLIRSREDTGIVTILDARIVKKQYGRAFLSSLPRCPLEIIGADGEVEYAEPADP